MWHLCGKIFTDNKFFYLDFNFTSGNSVNVMSISGGNSNTTTFINNNTNLDISNLVYEIDSKPFNVSYVEWTEKMVAMDIFYSLG